MANQYRVMPLESTRTCWLPMVFSVTVLPPAAADAALLLLPPAAGVLGAGAALPLPDLPQADTVRASAAKPATPHIFRIGIVSPSQMHVFPLGITCGRSFQFTAGLPWSPVIGRRQADLATEARSCTSVTLPPDLDTSLIGRWFSRLTTDSRSPWSAPVTAADEAAHRERHPDRQRAQGELAQARGQQRAGGGPADPPAPGPQGHRG